MKAKIAHYEEDKQNLKAVEDSRKASIDQSVDKEKAVKDIEKEKEKLIAGLDDAIRSLQSILDALCIWNVFCLKQLIVGRLVAKGHISEKMLSD